MVTCAFKNFVNLKTHFRGYHLFTFSTFPTLFLKIFFAYFLLGSWGRGKIQKIHFYAIYFSV